MDLGFTKTGVTNLEVTIIALPRAEDLAYRRNRPPMPVEGPLGTFDDQEMPGLITRIIAARSAADPPPVIIAQAPAASPAAQETNAAAIAPEPEVAVADAPSPDAAPAEAVPPGEATSTSPEPEPEAIDSDSIAAGPDRLAAAASPVATRDVVEAIAAPSTSAVASSHAALLTLIAALTSFLLWSAARSRRDERRIAIPRQTEVTPPMSRHPDEAGPHIASSEQAGTHLEARVDIVHPSADAPRILPTDFILDVAKRQFSGSIEILKINFDRTAPSTRA
jgi:hypothetical protein